MGLNNINLQAYNFNPFGNLNQGLLSGYNATQNAALNKLKAQLLQQQMQSSPVLDNLRQSEELKNNLSTYSGIDQLEKIGKISSLQANQARAVLNNQQSNIQARTNSLNNVWKNLPAQIKQNYLASGGNPEDFSPMQLSEKLKLTPQQNENFQNMNKKSAEKKNVPATTQQQIDYSTAFHTAANTINDEDINALYNPFNRMKYHLYDMSRVLDPNLSSPPGYDAYQESLSKMKNLKALYTKAVRGSVGVTAQKLLNQLLDPSLISNPQQGKDRIKALVDQLDLETQTLQKNVNKPFSEEKSIKNNKMSIPKFNTQTEFQTWYKNLSPTEKQSFKQNLGA